MGNNWSKNIFSFLLWGEILIFHSPGEPESIWSALTFWKEMESIITWAKCWRSNYWIFLPARVQRQARTYIASAASQCKEESHCPHCEKDLIWQSTIICGLDILFEKSVVRCLVSSVSCCTVGDLGARWSRKNYLWSFFFVREEQRYNSASLTQMPQEAKRLQWCSAPGASEMCRECVAVLSRHNFTLILFLPSALQYPAVVVQGWGILPIQGCGT